MKSTEKNQHSICATLRMTLSVWAGEVEWGGNVAQARNLMKALRKG